MKKSFILILLSLASQVHAQDLDIGGYLENNLGFTFADTGFFADNATIRVEGAAGTEAYALEAHVLVKASTQPLDPLLSLKPGSKMESLYGMQISGLMAASPDTTLTALLQTFDLGNLLTYLPYSTLFPSNSVTIDRALIKLFTKRADIYIGRQQMAWGTGYAFNPTDIWNMKNPLDVSAPKVGVSALRLEIPFGSLSNINLIGIPGPDVKHSSAGLRIKTNLKGFDLSVSGSRYMNADREIYGLPEKVIAGLDFAGQITDVGIWAEAALVNPRYDGLGYADLDSAYAQVVAGTDYTFESGLYVLAEYFLNGLGEPDPANYSAADIIYLFGGDMSGLGRDYIMAGLRKTLFDKFDCNLFSFINADDQSAILIPGLDYTWSDEISLNFAGTIPVGNKADAELASTYPGVSFKATAFF